MQVNDRVRIELKQQVTPFLTNDSKHSTTNDLKAIIRFLTLSRFSRSGQVYVPSSPEDASLSIGAVWQIRPPSRRAGLQYASTAPWQAATAPLKQCTALARHSTAPCSRCCLVCGCEAHCGGALHAVCRRNRDAVRNPFSRDDAAPRRHAVVSVQHSRSLLPYVWLHDRRRCSDCIVKNRHGCARQVCRRIPRGPG